MLASFSHGFFYAPVIVAPGGGSEYENDVTKNRQQYYPWHDLAIHWPGIPVIPHYGGGGA